MLLKHIKNFRRHFRYRLNSIYWVAYFVALMGVMKALLFMVKCCDCQFGKQTSTTGRKGGDLLKAVMHVYDGLAQWATVI
jgi:hypothetical protein